MENVIFCALDLKGIPREPAGSPQGVHREPPGSTQGGPRESPGSSQGVSREAPGRPRGGPREAPRKRQGGLREAPGRCTKYGLHHRFLRFLRFGNRCTLSMPFFAEILEILEIYDACHKWCSQPRVSSVRPLRKVWRAP